MATGILGVVGPSTNMTYTAPADAKLMITAAYSSGVGSVLINGASVLYLSTGLNGSVSHFVGAGQLVTITNAGNIGVVVSVLEGA
ncbi:hypothetical protein RugamoR64_21120 [Duganella rhizosphaerae]|uniref:hypothetical protein n=1 Tax=Duganella rhizosphaerae TaxID=2885763 RepID=UPI0030E9BC15